MVFRHILAVLAALFLASAGMAAAVRLGPEVPFADITQRPAGISNYPYPMVAASNGRDFLIGWAGQNDFETELVTMRVNHDGSVPAPPRHTGYPPHASAITRRDEGYLLVTYGRVRADPATWGVLSVRLDEDGVPISEPVAVAESASLRDLISNGSTHLLVINEKDRTSGIILDAGGAPLRKLDFDFRGFQLGGVVNGHYVFLTATNGGNWKAHTVADDDTISDVPLPQVTTLTYSSFPTLGPEGILFTWNAGGHYTVIGYDGSVIQPPADVPLSTRYTELVKAVWTGGEFLLVYRNGEVSSSTGYRRVYTNSEALRMS